MDPVSEMQNAVFNRGTDVGKLAQQLFPDGIDASPKTIVEYHKAIAQTKELIQNKQKVIYEASFNFSNVLSIADIVINEGDSLEIFEVKSSVSISETYLQDAALQYWVISNSGYSIKDFSIVYINNKYVRNGELDLNVLFKTESVLNTILSMQDWVEEKVNRFKEVLRETSIPDIDIGEHCHIPYICSFFHYCRKHIPDNSVFDLSGLHLDKKYDLYRNGIIKLEDIPDDVKLPKSAQLQLDVYKSKKSIIDIDAIKDFLSGLNYPIYFMDFETFQPAVPMFDNSKPYMQIPFQYSVHYKKSKKSKPEHFDFLAEASTDPRIKFITNLLKVTKGKGDIITYNKTFEITRLKEIAETFPEFNDEIQDRISRIKDLMLPFQKKYYYSNDMKGSYSIKYVLPALIPELSYENLQINEGGLASIKFESLFKETDLMKIADIRTNLLEYCKLDTFAMVKLLEKLESF
jgi:CRISPR/Cas system-associated exonuclease Cas4 (RecB family)